MKQSFYVDDEIMRSTQNATVKLEAIPPSLAIAERVAALEAVDYTDLDPLYETLDPDALDSLVMRSKHTSTPLQIEFTYHGYDVTVTGYGVVHIDEDVAFEEAR